MNRGAEKLKESLTSHGAKAALARDVGVEPYQLSHWLRGDRKPDPKQRAWLEDNMGIHWRSWDEDLPAKGAA